ncbi:unnamed protein product [Lathyrus sativus]|nr:unnamed protein product [Lathyrus sativus]
MHLVTSSRDERTISRAIELNEELQKVRVRYGDLVPDRNTTTTANEQVPKVLPEHDDVVSDSATTIVATHFNLQGSEEEEEP